MRLAIYLLAYMVILIAITIIAAPISEHEGDITLPDRELHRRMAPVLVAIIGGVVGVAGGQIIAKFAEEVRMRLKGNSSPEQIPTVVATPPPVLPTATSSASQSEVDQEMVKVLKGLQDEIEAGRKHDADQDALLGKLTAQVDWLMEQVKQDREHDNLQDGTLQYILNLLKGANIVHTPEEVEKCLKFELGLNSTQLSQPMGEVAQQYVRTHKAPV